MEDHNRQLRRHAADEEQQSKETVDDYLFTKPTIVTHGRLDEVKNLQRLIKAFSLIRKQNENVNLLIIGEGTERSNLEELIDKYGLKESVCLIGFKRNPYKYLSKSSLYVLTSFTEGFPNSLVEAMFFLPVVSVNCKSGPKEILEPNNEIDENKSIYTKAE